MQGIAEQLAPHFQVVAIDWLGFGQSDRPALNYQPTLYRQLLQDFVRSQFHQPIAVVAAGHAAGYAMQAAQQPHLILKTGIGGSDLEGATMRDGCANTCTGWGAGTGAIARSGAIPLRAEYDSWISQIHVSSPCVCE
jgi:pimeloyl-ACP methyl ester carboxylesterase